MDVLEQDPQTANIRDPELAETIRDACRTVAETIAPGFLCRPFPIDIEIVRRGFYVDLCAWGIFNPFGPTIAGVGALLTPDGDWLLFSGFRHPRVSQAEIRGLLPDELLAGSSSLYEILQPIFSTNGGEIPLLLALPTHVRTIPDSPLAMLHLRELIYAATPHLMEDDLEETCANMERWPDPVQRAIAETSDALDRARSQAPRRRARRIGRTTFRRWWSLVTDLDHVNREVSQLDFAWKRSIEIAQYGVKALWEDDPNEKSE